jgi:serine/threonine protein kinase
MGSVYEGYDPALKRRIAIKTFLVTDAMTDNESRERFEREAQAAARLQHPNIVTVFELGNFGSKETPYIVMEYLGGASLASIINSDRQIPLSEALGTIIQLCRGLDYAHQRKVVHRDIKPANIQCLDDGRVKIMDFGIARIEGSDQITRSGVMVGTLHYMSPEQIRGESIDGRSDIFSAGCILYEMLSGKRPFQGDSPTSILYKIVNDEAPPLLDENPDLPQEIQEIIFKALAKDPDERFRTADEMAEELQKLLTVFQKSFPRLSIDLQQRLDELEQLGRNGKWAEVLPRAEELNRERPELELPRRLLRQAHRSLGEVGAGPETPEAQTKHLAEISMEFQQLYGMAQLPTVADEPAPPVAKTDPTAGELKLRTKTETAESTQPTSSFTKYLIVLASVLVAVVVGWLVVPGLLGPSRVSHSIRISSEPSGASIFLNGVERGEMTRDDAPVAIPLEGLEGDTISIELKQKGYHPALVEILLDKEAPSPVTLTLEPIPIRFEITSDPPGAGVSLDGREVRGATPLVLEFSPHEDHEIVLSLDGYESRSLRVVAGEELPSGQVTLEQVRQPGTLTARGPYPLSIMSNGGVTLAGRSSEPTVSLAHGRHQVRLYAPEVFLNQVFTVDIREGATSTLEPPGLGKVSIRAAPGNCEVFINGMPAGAPPIMNQDIAAGNHTVVFEWPDGVKNEQKQVVRQGRHTYVTGQKR